LNPAILNSPFFQVALPLMITLVATVWIAQWAQNKRFDDIHRRFDDRFADIHRRFDDIHRKLDEIIRRLDRIEAKLDDHDKRIVRLEARTSLIGRPCQAAS